MKSVMLTLALFTFGAAAQASPNVGDKAVYQGTYDGQPASQQESLTAYNPQSQQFKKMMVMVVGNGAPETKEEWVNAKDLQTDQAMQSILDNCARYGGTPQTITVPAGTFNTCKLNFQQGGFGNFGVVPFGLVSIDTVTNDGKHVVGSLSSYTRGH